MPRKTGSAATLYGDLDCDRLETPSHQFKASPETVVPYSSTPMALRSPVGSRSTTRATSSSANSCVQAAKPGEESCLTDQTGTSGIRKLAQDATALRFVHCACIDHADDAESQFTVLDTSSTSYQYDVFGHGATATAERRAGVTQCRNGLIAMCHSPARSQSPANIPTCTCWLATSRSTWAPSKSSDSFLERCVNQPLPKVFSGRTEILIENP